MPKAKAREKTGLMPVEVVEKIRLHMEKNSLSQDDIAKLFVPPVTQGAVSQWLQRSIVVTGERARDWETALPGVVTRDEIRPDIFDRAAA